MFSRNGKSTTSQHILFKQPGKHKPQTLHVIDSDDSGQSDKEH